MFHTGAGAGAGYSFGYSAGLLFGGGLSCQSVGRFRAACFLLLRWLTDACV
jgi:hypothetical protein